MKPLSRKSFLKGLACLPFAVLFGGVTVKAVTEKEVVISEEAWMDPYPVNDKGLWFDSKLPDGWRNNGDTVGNRMITTSRGVFYVDESGRLMEIK